MDFLLYIIVVVVFPMIASLADWTNSIAALIYRYIQEREKKILLFCADDGDREGEQSEGSIKLHHS